MIVLASAGLNLPRELTEHCRIEETPQQIVVDGVLHDVRSVPGYATIKSWRSTAKSPPYTLGSSAAEYIALFNALVKRTSEVLVVTGTRRLLGTYDAAVAATRVVTGVRKGLDARVFDCGLVELAAGLMAAYCGASARAGYSMTSIIEAGQTLAAASAQLCVPYPRDALIAKDRADLMPTGLAGAAGSLPIIGLKGGELQSFGTIVQPDPKSGPKPGPKPDQIARTLVELLQERYSEGSPLWVTVTYGDELTPARDLLALLRQRFDVRYALIRPFGPAGYLVLGSKAVGVSAHPIAAMNLMVKLPEAR